MIWARRVVVAAAIILGVVIIVAVVKWAFPDEAKAAKDIAEWRKERVRDTAQDIELRNKFSARDRAKRLKIAEVQQLAVGQIQDQVIAWEAQRSYCEANGDRKCADEAEAQVALLNARIHRLVPAGPIKIKVETDQHAADEARLLQDLRNARLAAHAAAN